MKRKVSPAVALTGMPGVAVAGVLSGAAPSTAPEPAAAVSAEFAAAPTVPVLAWKPRDHRFQLACGAAEAGRSHQVPASERVSARARVPPILFAVTAAGMTLASCSSPTGPPGPTGTLTGTLQAVGGRPGAGPRALAGQVTLYGANGTKFSITARANGRFSLPVTVGTYTVTGRSPQYKGGTADCQAPGPVTVTKGVTSTVEIDCQEK